MRKICRTLGMLAVAAAVAVFASSALRAAPEDDDGDAAEAATVAKDALDKAVAKGDELFHSKAIGAKSCASCHENPDKPNLDLKARPFGFGLGYPSFSKRSKVVVTMQQKINEMVKFNSKGKELDHTGTDIAAIEAYVTSLKKK
jgi:cytochrome c